MWLCLNLLFVGVFVFVSADLKIITAKSGQDVTLTCRAPNNNITAVKLSRTGQKPEYVFVYNNGQFLQDEQDPFFKNRVVLQDRQIKDGNLSLILKNVMHNDTGTYECCAFMKETQSWRLSSIIKLTVPPDLKTITAKSGQDVTLTCRASNNNITVVKWRRTDLGDEFVLLYHDGNSDTLKQHPSFKNRVDLQDRQMKNGDVSLILRNGNTADTGTYMCDVFMKEKRIWEPSQIIYLKVFPPEQKIITAESGHNVTLPCRAPNNNKIVVNWTRTDLRDKNVFLYRDGHFPPANQHPSFKNRVDLLDRQMKDGDVSLILRDVNTDDIGTYVCCVFMEKTYSGEPTIIFLRVVPPGQTGGGKKESGSVWLAVGLSVSAVILVAAVGLSIFRKRHQQSQNSYLPPVEMQSL